MVRAVRAREDVADARAVGADRQRAGVVVEALAEAARETLGAVDLGVEVDAVEGRLVVAAEVVLVATKQAD